MADKGDPDSDDFFNRMEDAAAEEEALRRRLIPFDWRTLPRVEHGLLQHPLSLRKGFAIAHASGVTLRLDDLYQYGTYSGVLLGLPLDPESAMMNALESAMDRFPHHHADPFLVPPVIQAGTRQTRDSRTGPYYDEPWHLLPAVASFGSFTASQAAHGSDEAYSSVLMVWFQNGYGVPDDPVTLEHMRGFDWEKYTHNWTP